MPSILSDLIESIVPSPTRGLALALPTIKSLVTQGTPLQSVTRAAQGLSPLTEQLPKLSANEIIRQVRALGFKIQRQAALKTITAIRQQTDSYEYISQLTPGKTPLQAKVPVNSQRQRLKYQYTVVLSGENSVTGDIGSQFIRINSPRLLTKAQAIGIATEQLITANKYAIDTVTSSNVTLITKQNPNQAEI